MCGIVGYIGPGQAAPILIQGLQKLEYRGYDSAGVAVLDGDLITIKKAKGRLSVLSQKTDGGRNLSGNIGIGHTRWATHGAPSDENSHPHVSQGGHIAVVHNGIIENYKKLKESLMAKGYAFLSDTDTEVISHLLDYYYCGNMIDALVKAINRLEGSYALGVISSYHPGEMFAVRKDSPLIVGLGEDRNYIASDIPAVLEHTRKVYLLEDKEIVWFKGNEVKIFDIDKQEVQKDIFHVTWDAGAAEKGGFEHFMLKEIYEQPSVIRDTISPRIRDGKVYLDDLKMTDEDIAKLSRIYVVGCGSAYHVGVVGKYVIEDMVRISVSAELASEFRYRKPILTPDDLVVVISQSGETADTLAAMREAKRLGCRVLAIVNVVGSSVAREADDVIYTWAGPEIAVATTKAYSAQLQVLYLLSLYLADKKATITEAEHKKIVAELLSIPDKVSAILKDVTLLQEYAASHYNAKDVFFLGRGLDYCLALEGSLKLKEISYIHSEAYAAGELKHGTISLIEEGTIVTALATQRELFEKMLSNIKEVSSRGAVVFAVAMAGDTDIASEADTVYYIPKTLPVLAPALTIVPLQIFAYYMAVNKACDVDKPRNLAKSVTVE